MSVHVALLRAVNVGGTGKLPMAELRAMCEAAGFANVRTYIASGNVVLESPHGALEVKDILEGKLLDYAGKRVGVAVRSAKELAAVQAANPFAGEAPNRTVAIFLDHPPGPDALDTVTGCDGERIVLGKREIYVHYGDGMSHSKLRIPAASSGTARNMNTVSRLVALSS